MNTLRNSRREKFAQEFAKGKSATEAMALAGYSDPRNSTRMTKNDEIRRRVHEIQNRGAARAEVSVASLVQEFDDARKLAMERGQASAAVAATMGKAKITGLMVDRAEVGNAGDFDSMDSITEILAKVAEEAGPAVAQALAQAFDVLEESGPTARRSSFHGSSAYPPR